MNKHIVPVRDRPKHSTSISLGRGETAGILSTHRDSEAIFLQRDSYLYADRATLNDETPGLIIEQEEYRMSIVLRLSESLVIPPRLFSANVTHENRVGRYNHISVI